MSWLMSVRKWMTGARARTGVCVIRVQSQSTGFLYTVTLNPDIIRASADTSLRFADLEQTTEAVRRFLAAFTELEKQRGAQHPSDSHLVTAQ